MMRFWRVVKLRASFREKRFESSVGRGGACALGEHGNADVETIG